MSRLYIYIKKKKLYTTVLIIIKRPFEKLLRVYKSRYTLLLTAVRVLVSRLMYTISDGPRAVSLREVSTAYKKRIK